MATSSKFLKGCEEAAADVLGEINNRMGTATNTNTIGEKGVLSVNQKLFQIEKLRCMEMSKWWEGTSLTKISGG